MSGIWPGNTQCVAMLTFDVDGVSSWLRRNPDFRFHPSLMSMAEYGPSVATPRILDLLDSYSVKASFYIPGYVAETHADLVKEIVRRGHEVGHHGYLHESPASLSPREELSVLEKGCDILTRLTGQAPQGYRAPGWELSERSIGLLASHNFLYDSSLMGDDAPYILKGDTPQRMVEIPVHWLLDDAPYFVYAHAANRLGPMRTPEEVYSAWVAEFEGLYRYGRAFTLTMHEFIYALAFVSPTSEKVASTGVPTELIRGDVFFWQSLVAAAVLVAVPVGIIYNFFLDRLVTGLTMGAVKG